MEARPVDRPVSPAVLGPVQCKSYPQQCANTHGGCGAPTPKLWWLVAADRSCCVTRPSQPEINRLSAIRDPIPLGKGARQEPTRRTGSVEYVNKGKLR